MAVSVGTQLGSYEITALLGKGGFDEVYRGKDKKLKREVAIKILPDEFSKDPDRLTRFQREAEVLASGRTKLEAFVSSCRSCAPHIASWLRMTL
jgi:hypothetical protein